MLELQHVGKRFGETVALEGIDLRFAKGELCCIVGPSGSGKTTLLQILGGTELPGDGAVLYRGCDIAGDRAAYRRRHVGFVYQEFNLIDGLTVAQNAVLGAELCGVTQARGALDGCLSRLSLPRPTQRAGTLSGGERQRTALARALLKKADVLLADEPTGNLDPANADAVFSALRAARAERCIIVVTHDVERARRFADRVICLEAGRVVSDERILQEDKRSAQAAPAPTTTQNLPATGRRTSPLLLLFANSLRKNRWRVALIALVLALCLLSLSVALDMQTLGERVQRNVNVNYLETDLLTLSPAPHAGTYTLDPAQVSPLVQDTAPAATVELYGSFDHFSLSHGNALVGDAAIKWIGITDFFRDRLASFEIEGSFPQDENEILLSTDAARTLFGEGIVLGGEVTLSNGQGQSRTVRVSGINHTVSPQGQTYTFAADTLARGLACDAAAAALAQPAFALGHWKVTRAALTGKEQLLYGRAPAAPNEILLSHTALTLRYFEELPPYTLQQVENGEVSPKLLEALYAEDLYLNARGFASGALRVVGFYRLEIADGAGSLPREMRFGEDTLRSLHTPRPNAIALYFGDADAAKEALQVLQASPLSVDCAAANLRTHVENWTVLYRASLFAMAGVLSVILAAVLLTFCRILIAQRRREVAILRSLGARGSLIVTLLLLDFAVIYMLALLLAGGLAALYPLCFSRLARTLPYLEIRYPTVPLLLVGALVLPAMLLPVLPAILRLLRITPAVLFKEE